MRKTSRSMAAILLGVALLLGGCSDDHGDFSQGLINTRVWGAPVTLESENGDVSCLHTAFGAGGRGMAVWVSAEGGEKSIHACRFDGENWGVVTRLDAADGGASDPHVAVNAAGEAVAVWQQDSGGHESIMANRFDGVRWSGARLLETSEQEASHPRVAMDAAGRAVAVWHQREGYKLGVHVNRLDGMVWGGAARLGEDACAPEVAMNSAGRAMVVYQKRTGSWDVHSRLFVDGVWNDEAPVAPDVCMGYASDLRVAMDDAGRIMVIWGANQYPRYILCANHFDGAAWGGVELLADSDLKPVPDLAMNGAGQAVVSWQCTEGIRTSIRVNRFDSRGWAGAEAVVSCDEYNAQAPRVCMDAAGHIAVFWQQSDGYYNGIHSNRFDGKKWEGAVKVERDAGTALSPRPGFDARGRVVALWRQADGVRFALRAARRDRGIPDVPDGVAPVYPLREWTCMYYVSGDNNLSDDLTGDVNRMEEAGSDENVNLVVQTEFSDSYGSLNSLGSRTYRARLIQDEDDSVVASTYADLGRQDMTDPRTLVDFIRWAARAFPARRYALVLNDHGDSWRDTESVLTPRGILTDDTDAPGRMMSIPDLAWALETAGVHLELINFSACLMGAYEVAYELRDLAEYVTFSEEITYGDNSEDVYLGALRLNPSMGGAELGEEIVRSTREFFERAGYHGMVRSLIDLNQMDGLEAALASLARIMVDRPDVEMANICAAVEYAVEYCVAYLGTMYDQRDLGDFLDRLAGLTNDGEMLAAVQEAQNALAACVICNAVYAGLDGDHLLPSQGLSVYLPDWNGRFDSVLALSRNSCWDWNWHWDRWLQNGVGVCDYEGLNWNGGESSPWLRFTREMPLLFMAAKMRDMDAWAPTKESDRGDVHDHRLVMDDEGRAMVVWRQADEASRYSVYARAFDATSWGTAQLLESFDEFVYAPRVGMDSSGKALTVFARRAGNGSGIHCNRFDGAAWSGVRALQDDGDFAFSPELSVNASGRAVALWREFEGHALNLYARMYDDGAWGAAVPLEIADGPVWAPRVFMNAAGRAVACWHQGFDRQVRVSLWDGVAWSAPMTLDGAEGFWDDDVHVFIDAGGRGVVVWRHDGAVLCRKFDRDGWGESATLGVAGFFSHLKVAANGSGGAVAAWVREEDGRNDLCVRRFDGTEWGGVEVFPSGEDYVYDVALAMNASGEATLIYTQNVSETVDVLARRFDGVVWSAVEAVEELSGEAYAPLVTMDAAGRALVIWRGANWPKHALYAGRFDGAVWETPVKLCESK